jgi:putative hemolysin
MQYLGNMYASQGCQPGVTAVDLTDIDAKQAKFVADNTDSDAVNMVKSYCEDQGGNLILTDSSANRES